MSNAEVKKGDRVKIVNSADKPSFAGQVGVVMAVFPTEPATLKVLIRGVAFLYLKPDDVEVLE
ncbi:MAG: hypothetical protein BWK73_48385 [Thiothrix lacustris]|uniref:KOW domain-containing protein n=1 Tax=Thiothrix lacustris TaxID=525917 RepID=A0A1Y1Q9M6_9GAMM|nr:MAG: hypothetical protein BWK73_48385 [Thiothrix lacustris]